MIGIHQFLELLFNPLALFIFLFLVVICSSWWTKTINLPGFIAVFLFLIIISTGWFASYLTLLLERQYEPINLTDKNITWIVVLSGGQSEKKGLPDFVQLNTASIKRVLEGVRLMSMMPQAKLLLSGGGYQQQKAESRRMQAIVSWIPWLKGRFLLEETSVNTADQAQQLKPLLGKMPFYLVTSAIHMRRAMALFKAQGLNPIAAPTDYTLYWQENYWQTTLIPNARNISYLSIALHELMGWEWAKLNHELPSP